MIKLNSSGASGTTKTLDESAMVLCACTTGEKISRLGPTDTLGNICCAITATDSGISNRTTRKRLDFSRAIDGFLRPPPN